MDLPMPKKAYAKRLVFFHPDYTVG